MREITPVASKNKSSKPASTRKHAHAAIDAPAPFAEKIPFIRSLILDSVEPGTIKKIFLFGSYASGKATPKSDIDLCVIIGDELTEQKTDINLKIAIILFDNKIIPADVLVYTEEQFVKIKNPNGIKNTIMTEGRIIYE